jgi:hypothetical protein
MADDKAEQEAPPGLATPAAFTQEQVDALVRGKADVLEVAKILEAHRQPASLAKPRKLKFLPPIKLQEKEIAELADGKLPSKVAERLDEAAKKDKNKVSKIDDRLARPSVKPPRY